jgi:hypothetical protein
MRLATSLVARFAGIHLIFAALHCRKDQNSALAQSGRIDSTFRELQDAFFEQREIPGEASHLQSKPRAEMNAVTSLGYGALGGVVPTMLKASHPGFFL